MKRGIATFSLDYGKCPRWLFERMVKLGRSIVYLIVEEEGPEEFIRRISDPVWFQSLGTVLAFDWNASGLTTILTAVLKEAIRGEEKNLNLFICGGKGKTSRKTPEEIVNWAEKLNLSQGNTKSLVYNSKMAAKVDSSLVQDGFQIYHHSFFFTSKGAWAVVQQGMNIETQTARRYHWFSRSIKDLIEEPHSGIASELKKKNILNLTSSQSEKNREVSLELTRQNFNSLIKDIYLLRRYSTPLSKMAEIERNGQNLKLLKLENKDFKWHPVVNENFSKSRYLEKILERVCAFKPQSYENLLSLQGVGPKTIRALSLVAEVIYGARPSYQDPARYSFAHGGKDHVPYSVDRSVYDKTIKIIEKGIKKSQLSLREKEKALNRLHHFYN